MKTLYLTLSKKPFEVMVTGEKTEEFRKYSAWIESRLYNTYNWEEKKYDVIQFTNGYGKDKPFFTCRYRGFDTVYLGDLPPRKYSNGLVVDDMTKGDFVILLGEIIAKGNIRDNGKEEE